MSLQDEISLRASQIYRESYQMSIGELINLYKDGELDIHPEFQRVFRWSDYQKTKLIESIMLNIPIPPIFVSQNEEGVWDVIDGVQRLSTIFEFVGIFRDEEGRQRPPMILQKTDYLPSFAGVQWESENPELAFTKEQQLRFKRSRIDIIIMKKESDPLAKYELFQRLNKVAIFYVVVGLALAVAGGTLLERLHMEKHVEQFVFSAGSIDIESPELTRRERVRYAREQAVSTFKKVAPYILVGVGLGAVIHNWIPESWIETVLGGSNPFGVVLAVLVGVPMYADIFGTIPVAEALLAKGAQLGTVLAFMMAVTTLSLPSMIMLRKAVKPRLLGLFIAICTSGIILIGYLFNVFQFYLISI